MKKLLVLSMFFFLAGLNAATEEVFKEPSRPLQVEVGANLGTPGLLNVSIGIWGPSFLPLILRLTGGYAAISAGYGGEVGFIFDNEGSFRQFLAVGTETGGVFSPSSAEERTYGGMGLKYGFNWRGLSLDVGLLYGDYDRRTPGMISHYEGILPSINLGFSFIL